MNFISLKLKKIRTVRISMADLPFSLNIFRQIEYFQEIHRLDRQFESMLREWVSGGFMKPGLSEDLDINYPTWEIEKKILLWTVKHHKHLGSSIKQSKIEQDNDFLNDIHVSRGEVAFAGAGNVLKNLAARGLAKWDNREAIISSKGLEYGLVIDKLSIIEKERSIAVGDVKYRDEKLVNKRSVLLGFNMMYFAGILSIFLTLLLLGASIFGKLNIDISSYFPSFFIFIKYLLAILAFLPAALFTCFFLMTR
jgi:uncharacterized protein YdhG (YjbR/CyaY superfamily)